VASHFLATLIDEATRTQWSTRPCFSRAGCLRASRSRRSARRHR
jgi:hypothetical protein